MILDQVLSDHSHLWFRLSYGRWVNPKQAEINQKKAERRGIKVQIARLLTIDLGQWDTLNGVVLQKSRNRWDRRTDLQVAVDRYSFYLILIKPGKLIIRDNVTMFP